MEPTNSFALRLGRARAIVQYGKIEKLGDDWLIESSTSEEVYVTDGIACTCRTPDAPCKHALATQGEKKIMRQIKALSPEQQVMADAEYHAEANRIYRKARLGPRAPRFEPGVIHIRVYTGSDGQILMDTGEVAREVYVAGDLRRDGPAIRAKLDSHVAISGVARALGTLYTTEQIVGFHQ